MVVEKHDSWFGLTRQWGSDLTWQFHCATAAKLRLAAIVVILTLVPDPSLSATYYVDGACSSSGDGSTLTCGPAGPFRTIMEGVEALARRAGVEPATLNIRGAHDAFDGRYHEYIGLWGNGGTPAPGWCRANVGISCLADSDCPGSDVCNHGSYHALSCTASARCVIQGCPASECGADETPIITGHVRRTDWTDEGGGVWSRVMELRDPVNDPRQYAANYGATSGAEATDFYDPRHIMQGELGSKVFLQYDNKTSPGEGRWHYDKRTHTVYVNPSGTGNPNSDVKLWVSDKFLLISGLNSWPRRCPDYPACPEWAYLTFRRLIVEGGRWLNMELYPAAPGNVAPGIILDNIESRFTVEFGIIGSKLANFVAKHINIHDIGRGMSVPVNSFGFRFFTIDGGILTDFVVSHLGSAGQWYVQHEPGTPWYCELCDPPWNDEVNNPVGGKGNGFDVKQSRNLTVSRVSCMDTSNMCVGNDQSHNVVWEGLNVKSANICFEIYESYSDNCTFGYKQRSHDIVVKDSGMDDCGWNPNGVGTGMYIEQPSPPEQTPVICPELEGNSNEFTVKIYNNTISHVYRAGVFVRDASTAGTYIYNNTFWQDRDEGASDSAIGVWAGGNTKNLIVKNNIFLDFERGGIGASAAVAPQPGLDFDYNLYYDRDGNQSCVFYWKSPNNWKPTTGAICYGALQDLQAASFCAVDCNEAGDPCSAHSDCTGCSNGCSTKFGRHSIQADPLLVDPAAFDFTLCEGTAKPAAACVGKSPAVDAGWDVGLPFRGVSPDLGAVESNFGDPSSLSPPMLIEVLPVN